MPIYRYGAVLDRTKPIVPKPIDYVQAPGYRSTRINNRGWLLEYSSGIKDEQGNIVLSITSSPAQGVVRNNALFLMWANYFAKIDLDTLNVVGGANNFSSTGYRQTPPIEFDDGTILIPSYNSPNSSTTGQSTYHYIIDPSGNIIQRFIGGIDHYYKSITAVVNNGKDKYCVIKTYSYGGAYMTYYDIYQQDGSSVTYLGQDIISQPGRLIRHPFIWLTGAANVAWCANLDEDKLYTRFGSVYRLSEYFEFSREVGMEGLFY